jgi:hypothetical protein
VFIAIGSAFTIIFVLLAKETKNKPLEEIAQLFGDPLATNTLNEMISAEKAEASVDERAVVA